MLEKKKSKKQKKKDIEEKIAEYMQELRALQIRKGKKPQTGIQQLEHLRRIADCIMFSLEMKTLCGEMTGVAALTTALQRINEEIAKTLITADSDCNNGEIKHTITYEIKYPEER